MINALPLPRDLTPAQRADGARALLTELQRLYQARLDYMELCLGVREICDHYRFTWPLALAFPGAIESLGAVGAAVDECAAFVDKNFPPAEGANGDDPAGASVPAGEPSRAAA